MADRQFKFDVVMNAQNVINGASALAATFNRISTNSNTTSKRLRETATAMEAAARAANTERKSLIALAEAEERINKVRRESKANVGLTNARADEVAARSAANIAVAAGREQLYLAKAQTEQVRQRAIIENAADVNRSRQLRDQIAVQREQERQARAIARAEEARFENLAATRYAMYDVSNTARNLGLVMVTLAGASAAIAIKWEKDFAQVRRTVDGTTPQLENLRKEFISMTQDIPVSFEDIAEVGTLAGQLGIAAGRVASFTETTIKFSATTDVATKDAATAFGRLDNILLENSGQYENLASSVLKVGVNSVATESQILKVTTQIAATAKQAGFTADQVIGLSGAMASLGVPPELSRGVTTRVFGEISRAISEGGIKLEQFGNIAGMSGKQFASAWSKDAGATFQQLLLGLRREGAGAEQALRDLGITSVRDVPILLRLANSGNVVADAFDNAATGFKDNTELTKQYGIIADTTAARLQRLVNSFEALIAATAGGTLGPISDMLDGILERLKDFTSFVQTPAGQFFGGILLSLTALIGIIGLLVAAGTTAVAGMIALIQVFRAMNVQTGSNALSLAGLNATLVATGPAGAKAALGIRILTTAFKALAAATLILVLPDIAAWGSGVIESAQGIDTSFKGAIERLKELGGYAADYESAPDMTGWQQFFNLPKEMQDFQRMAANANFGDRLSKDIKLVDDTLTDLAANGDWSGVLKGLDAASEGAGVSITKLLQGLDGTEAALMSAGYTIGLTSEGLYELRDSTGAVVGAVEELTEAELEADAATQQFLAAAASGDASFFDLMGAYETSVREAAQAQADSTADMSDSWETFADDVDVSVEDYLGNLEEMIAAQTNWEKNLFLLRERGASDAAIEELIKLGEKGAPLIQDFVDGGVENIERLNAAVGEGLSEGPTAFAKGINDATPGFLAQVRKLGDDAFNEIITGLSNGSLTVEQVMNDMLGNVNPNAVVVDIEGNPGPAMADFDDTAVYAEQLEIWLHARGAKTKPARDQFDSDQAYAEALDIWMNARADTAPARKDFDSAVDHANALEAWIKAFADTDAVEAHLNWVARERTVVMKATNDYSNLQQKYNAPIPGSRSNSTGNLYSGGRVQSFASGGFPTGIYTGGRPIYKFAEPETRWEAFISGRPGQEARNRRILQEAASRLGMQAFASGGIVNSSAGYQDSYASRQSANAGRGAGPTMVELSARDRQLLARIPEGLQLHIGNETISRASNAANLNAGTRGVN